MTTRVKELRELKQLSQYDLAEQVQCSQNTISKIELGTCDPKASLLMEMSRFFGVSIDYILGISDYRNYTELQVRYGNMSDVMREYFECMLVISDKSKAVVRDCAKHMAELERAKGKGK